VLGGLSGALCGASAIPEDWISASEQANTPFFEEVSPDAPATFRSTATELVHALHTERGRVTDRLQQLENLLGS